MSKPIDPEALVERVLWHLTNQSQKLCWRGTHEDRNAASIGWWTVWYAWHDDPTPYETARHHVVGKQEERRRELMAELASYEPPDPEVPFRVQGRTAEEWHRTICAYLEYRLVSVSRMGTPRRLQPEAQAISDALWVVKQAYTSDGRPVRLHSVPSPPAPPQEVRVEPELQRDEAAQGPIPAAHDRDRAGCDEGQLCLADHCERAPLRRCRVWRGALRPGCRAARGHREQNLRESGVPSMSATANEPMNWMRAEQGPPSPPVHPDFAILALSGAKWRLLEDRFLGRVAQLANERCGPDRAAAEVLGVHYKTVLGWRHGLRRPAVLALPREVQAACDRIAERLWGEVSEPLQATASRHYHPLSMRFRRELAAAAIEACGGVKRQAARRLQMPEMSFFRWFRKWDRRAAR